MALTTNNALLADISLAALAPDALLLQFLHVHLAQLQPSAHVCSVVHGGVAPTLPVDRISEAVLSFACLRYSSFAPDSGSMNGRR